MIRVVAIYPNTKDWREKIFGKIVEWSKRTDLVNKGIHAAHFKIIGHWPPQEVLDNFPLNLQVEMIQIEEDKPISIKKFVIDVDGETIPNSQIPEHV